MLTGLGPWLVCVERDAGHVLVLGLGPGMHIGIWGRWWFGG
uniref:Replicase polyprotein 1ab n=2 Tax=unclassified Caudoviricetes TaxID=2788787 RepID=A0A8S5UN40_9CAUD|nr:MAG TPA: Replicase polyprotein 1ab [Siphoviridae sp. ctsus30]DAF95843.1 MAG TPA: Replicase polyprotein 1ab [Siphoviridae sp. ctKGQ3]